MLNYLNLLVLLTPIHPTPEGVGFLGQNRCKGIITVLILKIIGIIEVCPHLLKIIENIGFISVPPCFSTMNVIIKSNALSIMSINANIQ